MVTLATFQVLESHLWLVATLLGSTGVDHFPPLWKVPLDSAGLGVGFPLSQRASSQEERKIPQVLSNRSHLQAYPAAREYLGNR